MNFKKFISNRWVLKKIMRYSIAAFLFMGVIVFLRGLNQGALDEVSIASVLLGAAIAIPISLLIGVNLAYKRLKEFGSKHRSNIKS